MLGIAVPDYIRQALPESAAAVQKICSANAELTIAVKHVDKMTSYARPARSSSGVLDFCCRLRTTTGTSVALCTRSNSCCSAECILRCIRVLCFSNGCRLVM